MQIAASAMQDRTEQPLANHIHRHHFHGIIAAVFHHHTVPASFFAGFNQLPAILHRQGNVDLGGGMLAVFHGRQTNRGVPVPGGGIIDQVQIFGFAHVHKVQFAGGVQFRLRETRLGHDCGRPSGHFGPYITNGDNLAALHPGQIADMTGAHIARTNKTNTDQIFGGTAIRGHRSCGEAFCRRCLASGE
jgi:hypothetical protein